MSGSVQTVLGPRLADHLGAVLIHEHIVFGPENADDWVPLVHRSELSRELARDLQAVRERFGLGCFIDLSAIGCSRDVAIARDVAEQSGVAVVMATGFWEGSSYPEWAMRATIDEMEATFDRELAEGIDGTGIRAGVIKVATSAHAIRRREANAIRAAARCQRRHDVAIITHTRFASMSWEQVAIFEQEGCDLSRIVIGHLDNECDTPTMEFVLRRGANIAFDRIGRGGPTEPDDAVKADTIARLVKQGWASRIVLAHDAARWFTVQGGHRPERPPYEYVFSAFVPMLRARSVTEADITAVMVENPARILTG